MLNNELDTNLMTMFQGEEIHRTNDENIFSLDISKIAQQDSDMAKFVPLMGQLVYEEYRRRPYDETNPEVQQATIEELTIALKGADKLILALDEKGVVVGYTSLEFYRSRQVAFIRDILVSPKTRGSGLGTKLYRQMFDDQETAAMISYTKTPEAAHLRFKLGQEYGFKSFFGDIDTEQEEVKKLQELTLDHMREEGILADQVAPSGFAILRGEMDLLSPLKPEEVKFPPTHILYPVFQRLLKLQVTCPKDTAVGLLVNFSPKFDQSLLK